MYFCKLFISCVWNAQHHSTVFLHFKFLFRCSHEFSHVLDRCETHVFSCGHNSGFVHTNTCFMQSLHLDGYLHLRCLLLTPTHGLHVTQIGFQSGVASLCNLLPDWFSCYFRVLGKSFRRDFWKVLK